MLILLRVEMMRVRIICFDGDECCEDKMSIRDRMNVWMDGDEDGKVGNV